MELIDEIGKKHREMTTDAFVGVTCRVTLLFVLPTSSVKLHSNSGSASKAIITVGDGEDPNISILSRKRKGSGTDLTPQSDSSKSRGDPSKSQSNKDKGLSAMPHPIVQTADVWTNSGEDHTKETHTDSEPQSKPSSPHRLSSSRTRSDDNLTPLIDGSAQGSSHFVLLLPLFLISGLCYS